MNGRVFSRMFGIAVFSTCFLNLFLPAAARYHWSALIFVRVLQGLLEVRKQASIQGDDVFLDYCVENFCDSGEEEINF